MECDRFIFFNHPNNEIICNLLSVIEIKRSKKNLMLSLHLPNIIIDKLLKLFNIIFCQHFHSISFNSNLNDFFFNGLSNDIQIFQNYNLSYFLIYFERENKIVTVYSMQMELQKTEEKLYVKKFVRKRYGNESTINYVHLENLTTSLSGILVVIWMVDLIKNNLPHSRNLVIENAEELMRYFISLFDSRNEASVIPFLN